MFRTLDETILVTGQITPADIADAAAAGVTMIINNRPDGEEPGQPEGAAIEVAVRDAGIAYRAIPVTHAGIGPDQIAAMADALAEAKGKVLAFCRSGTRSTCIWALAEAADGKDRVALAQKAAAVGYDVAPLLGLS